MDKELPSINKTPNILKIIEIKVIKLIFSFKKKYPNTAKKIACVVIIKFVFATVVLYIENTYAEKPIDKTNPAIKPERPEL